MPTVAKNIAITAEERVLRELAAVLEAEVLADDARASAEERAQYYRLFDRRLAIETKLLSMEPITRAGKLTRAVLELSRADEYLAAGDRDDDAPEGVGDGVWPFIRVAAAGLTGEGAQVVALVLEARVPPPPRPRPAEAAQGLRRALGARRLRRSRPGTRQVCSPAA